MTQNNKPVEISVEELDVIAGGSGDPALLKQTLVTFEKDKQADVTIASANEKGADVTSVTLQEEIDSLGFQNTIANL